MSDEILTLLIVFSVPVIITFMVLCFSLLRWSMKEKNRRENSADETRELQEMHRLCERLDRRLEALETLVLATDKEKKTTTTDLPR